MIFINKLKIEQIVTRGDVFITLACPVECSHCHFFCTKKGPWMPEDIIRRVAEEYSKHRIGIRITGGEPFYNLKKLNDSLNIFLKYIDSSAIWILTSGFFSYSPKNIYKNLSIMKDKNINKLIISIDRFHQKNIPLNNIENLLIEARNFNIKIKLHFALDNQSLDLIDKVARLIAIYQPLFALSTFAWIGRARAKLKKPELDSTPQIFDFFYSRVLKYEKIYGKKINFEKLQMSHDFKRGTISNFWGIKSEQLKFPRFSPTTFPEGHVFACDFAGKLGYMGDITKESLSKMIDKFSKTFLGYLLFKKGYLCNCFENIISPNYELMGWCEYCIDNPLIENCVIDEICNITRTGRKFIKISSQPRNGIKKFQNFKNDFLISINLNKNDLNQKTRDNILNFLNSLIENNIKFKIARPLPRCLFQNNLLKINDKFNIPKNCFECHELFIAEDGHLVFCPNVYHIKGPKFDEVKNRKEIFEYFEKFHNKLRPNKICEDCIYFMRKQCNGLCFKNRIN